MKAAKRRQRKLMRKLKQQAIKEAISDDELIDQYIDKAEDERTVMAKEDLTNTRRVTIDAAHAATQRATPSSYNEAKTQAKQSAQPCAD